VLSKNDKRKMEIVTEPP